MIVLGVDIGITKQNPVGWATLDLGANRVICHGLIAPRSDKYWLDRIPPITNALNSIMMGTEFGLVAFEFAHYVRNPQTMKKLAHVGGVVYALAWGHHIPSVGVEPKSAKKALTGNGNAGKECMIMAANERYGLNVTSSHEADAIGVALSGYQLYNSKFL